MCCVLCVCDGGVGGVLDAVYVVDKNPSHVTVDLSTPVSTSLEKVLHCVHYFFFLLKG